MSRPIVERRKLPPRRPVLEDMVQDAIHVVRSEQIAEAVNDAVGVITKGRPEDLHCKALHALKNRADHLLGITPRAPVKPPVSRPPNPEADALFAKPEAA